jgi:dTDP-4-dehydrorhamnose reductase
MRCLIVGATGQIGSHLAAACADRGLAHLGTWYRTPRPDYVPLDVRDVDGVTELVADYQPDVTFLAAGPGDRDCGSDELRDVLVGGTRAVAAAVARHGGELVLFSADEVFGECPTARREEDPVAPVNEFGRCKAAAEAAVRAALPDRHLILRTGWVFGPGDRGPFGRQFRRLTAGGPVEVATDRHGQPTYGPDLAGVAVELAHRGRAGTVHAVGPDRHTEFSLARLAAHLLRADVDLVAGRPAGELADRNPRPERLWLDRLQLRSVLGLGAIRGAGDALRAMRGGLLARRLVPARVA